MGPENNGRKPVLYMMMDGQPVEVKTDFAEITFSENRRGNTVLDNSEFSIRVKLPRSLRCRNRKRFVKRLMANGFERNLAQLLARGGVARSNRRGVQDCMRMSYQSYFIDLWLRGLARG